MGAMLTALAVRVESNLADIEPEELLKVLRGAAGRLKSLESVVAEHEQAFQLIGSVSSQHLKEAQRARRMTVMPPSTMIEFAGEESMEVDEQNSTPGACPATKSYITRREMRRWPSSTA